MRLRAAASFLGLVGVVACAAAPRGEPERGSATLLVINSGLDAIEIYGPAGLLGRVLASERRCFRLLESREITLRVVGPIWRYHGPRFHPWSAGGGWVWEIGTTPELDVLFNLEPAEKCEP